MSETAEKARALRLERLTGMLEGFLDHPPAALETLVGELKIGQLQPQLWEELHAAAARDDRLADLASAYRKAAAGWRLKQLPPATHAQLLMHAADFFQGLMGDADTAESFLSAVLDVSPDHAEAFERLERRYTLRDDRIALVELHAKVAATPPRPPEELAKTALNIMAALPAKTPVSDEACQQLLALTEVSPRTLSVLEAHCRKTGRFELACGLLEQAIERYDLKESVLIDLRRRLIDLYTGDAGMPARAMAHVEELLSRDALDAHALAGAERLLSAREVASRAAALLHEARRQNRGR